MSDITSLLLPGSYAAVYILSGSSIPITSEAMEEVNDLENGNPRYTVYQIANDDKQILDPSILPVFEYQTGGTGAWTEFSASQILEIQYPGARVVLVTPKLVADVVRLKSGNYFAKKQLYGALSTKISDKTIMKELTPLGSKAKCNFPTIDEFSLSLEIFLAKVCAGLVANDITLTHQKGGTAGNAIHYVVVNPAATHALTVVYTENLITVTLAYASAITTTNQQLRDAINSNPNLMRLGIVAECDPEDENLLAAAFTNTAFAGGLNAEKYSNNKSNPICVIIYGDTDTNIRWEGFGFIQDIDVPVNVEDFVKHSINIIGNGKLYFRDR